MRLDWKKWPFNQSQVTLEEQYDCVKAFVFGFVFLYAQ